MTKTELVDAVAQNAGVTKKDASRMIDAFTESVTEALARGKKVQLVGFGTFEVRRRAARQGRNPQTGETIDIAARAVPAFKPGKLLREAVR